MDRGEGIMKLQIGDTTPDFEAQTTEGDLLSRAI
jgi:peroxiredoxin